MLAARCAAFDLTYPCAQEQAEDLSQMWGTKKKEELMNKKLACEFKFLVCGYMAARNSAATLTFVMCVLDRRLRAKAQSPIARVMLPCRHRR